MALVGLARLPLGKRSQDLVMPAGETRTSTGDKSGMLFLRASPEDTGWALGFFVSHSPCPYPLLWARSSALA